MNVEHVSGWQVIARQVMGRSVRPMRSVLWLLSMSFALTLLHKAIMPVELHGQATTRLELGALAGVDLAAGEWVPRLGIQSHIGLGVSGVTGTFALVREVLPLEWTGGAWQLTLAGRVRPAGPRSWLSFGYGLTIRHRWARWDFLGRTDPIYSRTNTTDAAVIGVAAHLGRFRPCVDIYVTQLLDRDGKVGGHALFGVMVRAR